jgi:hypothetical protein
MGKIAYRLPSIEDLFNLPISHFYEENSLTFTLKIKNMDPELGMVTLACLDPRNCEVTYKKEATASVYYIQPPVVYYESFTEVHFNPMGIMKLIQDLMNILSSMSNLVDLLLILSSMLMTLHFSRTIFPTMQRVK